MKELKEAVNNITELTEENCEELKKMNENLEEIVNGNKKIKEDNKMLLIYKGLIKSSEKNNLFLKITIGILSISLIVLLIITAMMYVKYTHYRENSISKEELIDYLKD